MKSQQVSSFSILFISCCFLSIPAIMLALKIFKRKNTGNTFFNQIFGVLFLAAGTGYCLLFLAAMNSSRSDVVPLSVRLFIRSTVKLFSFMSNEPMELKNHTNCMKPTYQPLTLFPITFPIFILYSKILEQFSMILKVLIWTKAWFSY